MTGVDWTIPVFLFGIITGLALAVVIFEDFYEKVGDDE